MSETDELVIDNKSERTFHIFGRDVSQVPCFRNSFLYGISSGLGAGFLAFMKTSRPQMSTHFGFGTFFAVTMAYWFTCRYQYSKNKFEYDRLQNALRKHSVHEGTELEKEINKKFDSV